MSLAGFPDNIRAVLGSGWTGKDGLTEDTEIDLTRIGSSDEWSEDGTDTPNSTANRIRFRPAVQFGTAAQAALDAADGGSWYSLGYASLSGASTYTFLDVWSAAYPLYMWSGGYFGGWLTSSFVSYNDEVFKLMEEGAGIEVTIDPASEITDTSAKLTGNLVDMGEESSVDGLFRYREHVEDAWNQINASPLTDPDDIIEAADWSTDGSMLAVGAHEDAVYLYDPSDWSIKQSISTGNGNPANDLSLSPDGSLVAFVAGQSIEIRKTSDGTLEHSFNIDSFGEAARFSPDGNWLAFADGNDVEIQLVSDWSHVTTLNDATDDVHAIAWSPDSATIAYGGRDDNVHLHQTSDWTTLGASPLQQSSDRVLSIDFSADGALIAYGGRDNTVHVHQTSDWSFDRSFEDAGASIQVLRFSADSTRIAFGASGNCYVRQLGDHGALLATLQGESSSVRAIAWHPDGELIAYAGLGEEVYVHHTANAWTRTAIVATLTETGSFSDTISGLAAETQYQAQAIGKSGDTEAFSDTITFTTTEEADDGQTHETDFSEHTVGQQPGDWTRRWTSSGYDAAVREVAGATSGQALRLSNTDGSSAQRLLAWDAIDGDEDRDDADILLRFRISDDSAAPSGSSKLITVRASGAAGDETAYQIELGDRTGTPELRLVRFDGGTATQLAASGFAFDLHTWYEIRFRVQGDALQARLWLAREDEPAAWAIDTTDATITAAGWIGVGQGVVLGTVDYDAISIGTGDQDAPALPALPAADRTASAGVVGARSLADGDASVVPLPVHGTAHALGVRSRADGDVVIGAARKASGAPLGSRSRADGDAIVGARHKATVDPVGARSVAAGDALVGVTITGDVSGLGVRSRADGGAVVGARHKATVSPVGSRPLADGDATTLHIEPAWIHVPQQTALLGGGVL